MTTAAGSPAAPLSLPVRGFAFRLAATTSCLIVITCASLSWFIVQRNLAEVERSQNERLHMVAEQLAHNAELAMLSGNRNLLGELARKARAERDLRYVHFLDQHGEYIASSEAALPLPGKQTGSAPATGQEEGSASTWETVVPVFTTPQRGQREELGFAGEEAGAPRTRKQIGSVVMGVSRSRLRDLRDRMLVTAAAVTALIVLLGVLLAAVLAQNLTRPLNSLVEATELIAQGSLNATVPIARNDEIGALATSFNEMVDSLARSRAELEGYSRNLEEKVRSRTERLEALNEELREANRLKTEFLATVSHELRTPLHVILGYTDMLSEGGVGAVNEDQQGLLQAVRRYSKLQLELLTDVLDFSRLTSGRVSYRVERFALAPLLRDIENLYQTRLAGGAVQLRVDVPAELELQTDRIKLQEILRNLVDNAVKFTEVGTVRLQVSTAPTDIVVIEVSDTGKGIPLAEQAQVFEPFQQGGQSSTRNTGGVGLGLSIVKQLCQALGGSVSLTSKEGSGSTFRVEIPRRLSAHLADDASASSRTPP